MIQWPDTWVVIYPRLPRIRRLYRRICNALLCAAYLAIVLPVMACVLGSDWFDRRILKRWPGRRKF